MKFSIVIPLYNKVDRVKRTLDSVCAQTWQGEWQCIVVDDGSTDGSGSLADAYAAADARFVCLHKDNGGVSSARNTGIRIAKGEWIVFLDADDELLPCALETFVATINRHPQCPIVCGRTVWVHSWEEQPPASVPMCDSNTGERLLQTHTTRHPMLCLWLGRFSLTARNCAIRRDVIERYGGFDERMSYFEDLEFALRMARCGRVAWAERNVAVYHQEEGTGLSARSQNPEREMVYYLPELIKGASFCLQMLLYENLLFTLSHCGHSDTRRYTRLLAAHFGWRHRLAHRLANRLRRHICR